MRGVADLPRLVTAAALIAVAAISWVLLARSAEAMSTMSGEGLLMDVAIAMMQPAATSSYLLVTSLMWMVMMAAMMTPAIVPAVMLFQRLDRQRGGSVQTDGALFASGYLLVWIAFAVCATGVQWGLHRAALLHTHLLSTGPVLAGALLIGAGIYQLTPVKLACLAHCQSPLGFLLGHWQSGRFGALRMGMHHGAHCLGCCWALMLLMFVGGVMSLAAMAVLSVLILAERLLPPTPWIARIPGVVLLIWGAWTLLLGI